MKKILIVLFLILIFSSCSEEKDDSKVQTITLSELCTKLNTDFIQRVKELEICKDDGCGIAEHENWFNANNYCNNKYKNITTGEIGGSGVCISYLFEIKSTCEDSSCVKANVTKEELMSYMKTELEDLNATCNGFFKTNPFERCESDHQSYLEVWKVQCNPTEEEIQEYLTATTGRCSAISENIECNEVVSNGFGFGPVGSSCENFENTYSSWITNPDQYTCFSKE